MVTACWGSNPRKERRGFDTEARRRGWPRAAEPFVSTHPNQYDVPGNGGAEGACRRLLEFLREGYVHVLVADVESNFNALRAEGLIEAIPLPPAITEAVVLARGLNIITSQRRSNDAKKAGSPKRRNTPKAPREPAGNPIQESLPLRGIARHAKSGKPKIPSRLKETLRKGRQGIPQGSVSSPLLSGCLHAPIVRNISQMAPTVHYSDNYHVVAKSGEGLLPIAKTLKAEFNRSPAGPLLLSKCIMVDARQGFAALGFIFKAKGKRAWLRPSHRKLEKCYLNFLGMIDDIVAGNKTPEQVRQILRGWCAAHRLWPHVGLWEKLLLGRLDQHYPPPTEVDCAGAGRRCLL